jgi:hypothetical protein
MGSVIGHPGRDGHTEKHVVDSRRKADYLIRSNNGKETQPGTGPLFWCSCFENMQEIEEFAKPYTGNFVPERISDIFTLVKNEKFPKKKDAQINFLADSLGGRPNLSLRRSRDICEKECAKQRRKTKHRIVRNEFYIECTCGYKGPALDNACRNCGAEIPLSIFGRIGRVPSVEKEES